MINFKIHDNNGVNGARAIKQRITYFNWADTGEIGIEMHLSKSAYEVRK